MEGKSPTPAFPLPAPYVVAAEEFANRELRLDALSPKEKPAWWPGSLYLFTPSEAVEETRRFVEFRTPEERDAHYFIGTNAAGMVFALDRAGRVFVFDEVEASDPQYALPIAESFEALLLASARPEA